jgi:choline-sulfatase
VFSRYLNFQRTVRTRHHKLIVYPQARKVQLFDLNKNPWELLSGDLAEDASMTPVREDLMKQLRNFQKELDDPLNLDDPAKSKKARPIWEHGR